MRNDVLIKLTAGMTFVLFIVVLFISIFGIVCGYIVCNDSVGLMEDSVDMANPDDPGAGWLVLGGIFGSFAGGFVGAILMALGVGGVIFDVLLYIPAFVGLMIWRKKQNTKAYWICMLIWLCLIVIGVVCLMVM